MEDEYIAKDVCLQESHRLMLRCGLHYYMVWLTDCKSLPIHIVIQFDQMGVGWQRKFTVIAVLFSETSLFNTPLPKCSALSYIKLVKMGAEIMAYVHRANGEKGKVAVFRNP